MTESLSDITKIRQQARQHIDQGSVTHRYNAERTKLIAVLNDVLATKIVWFLRCKRHCYTATGIDIEPIAEEFLQGAAEELERVYRIATRIIQLNGEPHFDPDESTSRNYSEYAIDKSLIEIIREDLIARRIAVESHSEILRWLANDDPTTCRMIGELLEKEAENANNLANMLATFDSVKMEKSGNMTAAL